MTQPKQMQRQLEHILDEAPGDQVEVIVQMESEPGQASRLARAAGEALSRRRLSLTPRDLLPSAYRKPATRRKQTESVSTQNRLQRATAETIALAKIQKMGLNSMTPLLKSGIVQAALSRMLQPAQKSSQAQSSPSQFWTSRSMPLRFQKEELKALPEEVPNIRSLHLNRRLSLPSMLETRKLQIEAEEILVSTWGVEQIKALSVWGAYGARGKKVTIGLLDTGIDATHPDLKGKVAHWAEFDSLGNLVPGSNPHDSDEHGTHCGGTLVGSNASGRFIGVAPEAKLAAALVLNGKEGGTDAQILAGINWAVEKKVDVISLSLGGLVMDAETPSIYSEAILTCMEAGIPVVAAIGNEGQQTTGSPGNDIFALSVGATDPRDRAAGFSGGRTQIIRESDYIAADYLPLPYSKPDLSAPGVAIYSSVPGGEWKAFNGTSMATPHVAGTIALLLSATTLKQKEKGAQRAYLLKDLICGSVEDIGESGQDHRYGFGRLDALRAVDFARERGY